MSNNDKIKEGRKRDKIDIDFEIRLLPILLHRAREALSTQFRPVFLIHDLSDPQWRVLRILENSPGIDTTHLAERSHLLGPSLSRIVRDLSQRGLIRRSPDPADGRRSFHTLTSQGQQAIEEISPYFVPIYEDLKRRLDAPQIAELNSALTALLEALDHLGDEALQPT